MGTQQVGSHLLQNTQLGKEEPCMQMGKEGVRNEQWGAPHRHSCLPSNSVPGPCLLIYGCHGLGNGKTQLIRPFYWLCNPLRRWHKTFIGNLDFHEMFNFLKLNPAPTPLPPSPPVWWITNILYVWCVIPSITLKYVTNSGSYLYEFLVDFTFTSFHICQIGINNIKW